MSDFPCKDRDAAENLKKHGFHVLRDFFPSPRWTSEGFRCPRIVRYDRLVPTLQDEGNRLLHTRLGWNAQFTKVIARCDDDLEPPRDPPLHRDVVVYVQDIPAGVLPPVFTLLLYTRPSDFRMLPASHNDTTTWSFARYYERSQTIRVDTGDAILLYANLLHASHTASIECHGVVPTPTLANDLWPHMLHLWSHESFEREDLYPDFLSSRLELWSEITAGRYKPSGLSSEIYMLASERDHPRGASASESVAVFPDVLLQDAPPRQNKYLRDMLMYEQLPIVSWWWWWLIALPLLATIGWQWEARRRQRIYEYKRRQ